MATCHGCKGCCPTRMAQKKHAHRLQHMLMDRHRQECMGRRADRTALARIADNAKKYQSLAHHAHHTHNAYNTFLDKTNISAYNAHDSCPPHATYNLRLHQSPCTTPASHVTTSALSATQQPSNTNPASDAPNLTHIPPTPTMTQATHLYEQALSAQR